MRITGIILFIMSVKIKHNNALYSDEDNALLPRLFHLDDHDRCLLQPGGLYCLGEFDLTPVIGPSRVYENIQKYAVNNPNAFNRSRLHRGYCVSERCPTTTEKNASLRFEQCVAARARRYALTARLRRLQYCSTQQQHAARAKRPPNAAQQLYLQVIYALFALNIIGTVYDVVSGNSKNKNRIISAWSVRASWQRLKATYDDGDPRITQLEVLHGIKVVTMLLAIYVHICVQHGQFYVINPQFLEKLINRADGVLIANGSTTIHFFLMISCFLTGYNLLIYSEKHTLSLFMLPVLVAKRFIRIAPVQLLMVGFAATYLPTMNLAAFSAAMEENSASCRRKFWDHVFFLQNIVKKRDNNCLIVTWFLAADMHLFILSSILTIIMYRRRHQALHLYAALSIISAVAAGVVAYVMGFRSFVYESEIENIRGLCATSESFIHYHMSTWRALPACFMGLFLAHVHYELQQANYDWSKNQWFKRLHPWTISVGLLVFLVTGMTFKQYTQPWVTALHVTLDKLIVISITSIILLGCINNDGSECYIQIMNYMCQMAFCMFQTAKYVSGSWNKFFGWRGWRVPARLSLPMMLCHWLVSVVVIARPVAYYTSVFVLSIDFLATVFYGYVISVPVALLVEIPVQRFFAQLF